MNINNASLYLKTPLRILLAISTLSKGGAERVMARLANWLHKCNYEIALTTFRTDINEWPLQRDIIRYNIDDYKLSGESGESGAICGLKRIIQAYRPTHFLSFMVKMNLRVVQAAKGEKAKVILCDRIFPPSCYTDDLMQSCSQLYPHADALVMLTKRCIDEWAASFMPRNKLYIIPNPYIPHDGEPTLPLKNQYLLAVARLEPQKGLSDLLRAFASFSVRYPHVFLLIAGQGVDEPRLHEQARILNIADKLRFVGFCPNPELLYKNALFFVSASHFEGFPNALVEAMYLGCPAIFTDCPTGPRELLGNNERGLLVPVGNIDELTNAMIKMYTNVILREEYIKNAYVYASKFTEDCIFRQWVDLFNHI